MPSGLESAAAQAQATEPTPPGLRLVQGPLVAPAARPKPPPAAPPVLKASATPQVIPASELLRKPSAPAPPLAPNVAAAASPWVLTVLQGEGQGQRYRIPTAGLVIGRAKGALLFPEDSSLSPLHASLRVVQGRLVLKDEGSTSGVFVSLTVDEPLAVRGQFCVGQRLFRYLGPLGAATKAVPGTPKIYGAPYPEFPLYAVEELLWGGRPGRVLTHPGPTIAMGSAAPTEWVFSTDATLAPRHCELRVGPSGAVLRDLSQGRGTFIRLAPGTERPLAATAKLRIGRQVLQIHPADLPRTH